MSTLPVTSNCSNPVLRADSASERLPEVVLRVGPEMKIEGATELRERMTAALDQSDHIILDVSSAEKADLSFVQLVCSAHQQATTSGKRLSWSAPLPPILIQLLRTAGITHSTTCAAHEDCLWPERSGNEKDGSHGG